MMKRLLINCLPVIIMCIATTGCCSSFDTGDIKNAEVNSRGEQIIVCSGAVEEYLSEASLEEMIVALEDDTDMGHGADLIKPRIRVKDLFYSELVKFLGDDSFKGFDLDGSHLERDAKILELIEALKELEIQDEELKGAALLREIAKRLKKINKKGT